MRALLLADARFPSGGHAHSGGLEAAVDGARVVDIDTLGAFLDGRLATVGRVAAALAAAACIGVHDLAALDDEAAARISSPALRLTSLRQGRQLLRSARAVLGLPPGPEELHHAVAIGVVSAAAGLGPLEAARWAAYEALAGPTSAGVRLLGLDPFCAWALVSGLAVDVEEVATAAAAGAARPLDQLPCCSAPMLEISAEHHAVSKGRLFAS
jgi:urease accessory protein